MKVSKPAKKTNVSEPVAEANPAPTRSTAKQSTPTEPETVRKDGRKAKKAAKTLDGGSGVDGVDGVDGAELSKPAKKTKVSQPEVEVTQAPTRSTTVPPEPAKTPEQPAKKSMQAKAKSVTEPKQPKVSKPKAKAAKPTKSAKPDEISVEGSTVPDVAATKRKSDTADHRDSPPPKRSGAQGSNANYNSRANRSPSSDSDYDPDQESDESHESEDLEDLEDPEVLANMRAQIRHETPFPPRKPRTFTKDPSRVAKRKNSEKQTRKAQLDRIQEKAVEQRRTDRNWRRVREWKKLGRREGDWIPVVPERCLTEYKAAPGGVRRVTFYRCKYPHEFFLEMLGGEAEFIPLIRAATNDSICVNYGYDEKYPKNFTDGWELLNFLGIQLLMGYHRLPDMDLYWSGDVDVGVGLVQNVMSRDRFKIISSNLHVVQPEYESAHPDDKLRKIRPLIELLNRSFQEHRYPNEWQSIDESMVKFKGEWCMASAVRWFIRRGRGR